MSVPAIIMRRERDTVAAFRAARATSPETARPPESLGLGNDLIRRRLEAEAVLRPGRDPGTLYLDEPSWAAANRRRHRLVLILLALAILAGAAVLLGTGAVSSR